MARRKTTSNCRSVIRVYLKRACRVPSLGGPGRAGPAMAGFFVEPVGLDFWNLEKSFVMTRATGARVFPNCLRSFVRNIRTLTPLTLFPRHRYTYLTFIALLIVPFPVLTDSIASDAKRCSVERRICTLNDGYVLVAVIQTVRRPHSRSESPEILGRVVFFVLAVGRSPPRLVARPQSDSVC